MKYIEVIFNCVPCNEAITDILSSALGEIGFESFVADNNGLTAYVQSDIFNENSVKSVVETFPIDSQIVYTFKEIEDKDWNEEWEKNYFQPLVVDDKCIIQSTFHQVDGDYDYRIYIDPKMAFGTGHHQTTELMMRQILIEDLANKSLLDMGCGTAILAILASMRGANPITAIDIDKWSYDNATENLQLNNIHNIEVKIGGAELLGDTTYDIVFANINRNILLNDMEAYVSVLNEGGLLFMSGFYTEDIPVLDVKAQSLGLSLTSTTSKDNWACVRYKKL